MCIYLLQRQFPNSKSNIIGSLYSRVGSVNVDPAANVAMLIFPAYSAAVILFANICILSHLLTWTRRTTVY